MRKRKQPAPSSAAEGKQKESKKQKTLCLFPCDLLVMILGYVELHETAVMRLVRSSWRDVRAALPKLTAPLERLPSALKMVEVCLLEELVLAAYQNPRVYRALPEFDLKDCVALRTLRIQLCDKKLTMSLIKVVRSLPNLRVLEIDTYIQQHIPPPCVRILSSLRLDSLLISKFELRKLNGQTDNLGRLTDLAIRSDAILPRDFLAPLKSLSLQSREAWIFTRLPLGLERLSLDTEPADLALLAQLTALRELELNCRSYEASAMHGISLCTQLTSVKLLEASWSCGWECETVCQYLGVLPRLTCLWYDGPEEVDCEALALIEHLSDLHLTPSVRGLAALRAVKSLVSLNLGEQYKTVAGLEKVLQLRHLTCSAKKRVVSQSLMRVVKTLALESVDLAGEFDDDMLGVLLRHRTLKRVSCDKFILNLARDHVDPIRRPMTPGQRTTTQGRGELWVKDKSPTGLADALIALLEKQADFYTVQAARLAAQTARVKKLMSNRKLISS